MLFRWSSFAAAAATALLYCSAHVQAQATSSGASSAATSATAAPASSSAATRSGSTNVATSLLPVPSSTGTAYNTSEAQRLAQFIPGYTYNLTEETLATRQGICQQTTQFCASAKCTSQTANVTVNFCNPETMGWNCKCNDNAESRLQPLVVPVNTYDCRLRTQACLEACQNTRASVAVANVQQCQNACNYVIGATCGTNAQQLPEYQVDKEGDKPKYYPDTSKGGVAIGVSSAPVTALYQVATVMSAVFGGVVLLLA